MAVNATWKLLPGGSVTAPPLAKQASRYEKSTSQVSGPATPPLAVTVGLPYTTFAVGRWSNRMAWGAGTVTTVEPMFATVTVQIQGAPTATAPPTLFVMVAARSGPDRTTSRQVLFPSFDSTTTPLGSTRQGRLARGLAKTPGAVALAGSATWKLPPGGSVTAPPVATQVSLTVKSMVQTSGPVAPPSAVTVGVS